MRGAKVAPSRAASNLKYGRRAKVRIQGPTHTRGSNAGSGNDSGPGRRPGRGQDGRAQGWAYLYVSLARPQVEFSVPTKQGGPLIVASIVSTHWQS